MGFDAETCNGRVKVLCTSDGQFIENPSPAEAIKFIVSQLTYPSHCSRAPDKIGVWWNTKFDFSVLFAEAIPDEASRKAFLNPEDEKGKMMIVKDGDGLERFFKVRYFASKGFTIQPWVRSKNGTRYYPKKTLRFYDAMMNYKSYGPSAALDYVAQAFGMPAKDREIDRERLGNEEGYYEANRDRVIKYCIEDCIKTRNLAEIACNGFADMMQELFGERIYAKYYFSAASFGKAWLDLRHRHLRNWAYKNLTLKEIEFIFQSYFGGIFDVRRFGLHSHFRECPECHCYHPATIIDIQSCYPSAIRTIPKLELLRWEKTNKYSPNAQFGFYRIKTYLNGFIPVKTGCNFSMYPEDSSTLVETYVTSWTLRWLIKHKQYFKVLESIEFFLKDPTAPIEYEFKDDIELMYRKRAELKKQMKTATGDEYRRLDSLQLALKLILNTGGYGCHASLRKHVSAYSNVILAALITDYCRAKIAEIAWQVGYENVIFIATDGICYIDHNQKFDESVIFGDDLGNVEYKIKKGEVMVLKNGIYWARTCKCPNLLVCEATANKELALTGKTSHLQWRNRGYEHLDVATLLEASQDKWKQSIKICVKRSDTIVQGAIKNDMSKVGVIKEDWKDFDLKSNRNRCFIELFPFMTFHNLMRACFPTEPYIVGDMFVNTKPIYQELTDEFKNYYNRFQLYKNASEASKHPRKFDKSKDLERKRRYWHKHKDKLNQQRRIKRHAQDAN